MLGAPSCAVWHGPPTRVQSLERLPHFVHFSSYRIFFNENNSVHHFSCQIKRMFTWELVVAALKARPCRWHNHRCRWELPTGSSLSASSWSYPAGRAHLQHSTGLALVRLTVTWITNSSTYNSLLVRITTFGPLGYIAWRWKVAYQQSASKEKSSA